MKNALKAFIEAMNAQRDAQIATKAYWQAEREAADIRRQAWEAELEDKHILRGFRLCEFRELEANRMFVERNPLYGDALDKLADLLGAERLHCKDEEPKQES